MQRLKSKGLVIATLAVLVLTFSAPLAQASIYSGYDHTSCWVLGIKCQEWELWVKMDRLPADLDNDGDVDITDVNIVAAALGSTPSDPNWNAWADLNNDGVVSIADMVIVAQACGSTGHLWNIKWKVTGSWPYTPIMYCFYLSYVKAWDDKGFSWKLPQIGLNGEVTLDHSNLYTWTYTQVCWAYALSPFTYNYITLKVGIYVGT